MPTSLNRSPNNISPLLDVAFCHINTTSQYYYVYDTVTVLNVCTQVELRVSVLRTCHFVPVLPK